ncbi:hypothetical protein [Nannocystis radixulma]|uniref:Uncharacterized protein n=1 Tax=Nannocystis radixulma TaxID=2995305 RepID=A0ABT5BII9_9BACT|nr:hypothetical protein [Nannocystis radixulma]MDC0673405.1 hypothetical protein [Nannocystis radixulma]
MPSPQAPAGMVVSPVVGMEVVDDVVESSPELGLEVEVGIEVEPVEPVVSSELAVSEEVAGASEQATSNKLAAEVRALGESLMKIPFGAERTEAAPGGG